jgi:hypothetical protein
MWRPVNGFIKREYLAGGRNQDRLSSPTRTPGFAQTANFGALLY